MNGNLLTIVNEHEHDEPLIQKIDSLNDNCYRGCHNKNFRTIKFECVDDIKHHKY